MKQPKKQPKKQQIVKDAIHSLWWSWRRRDRLFEEKIISRIDNWLKTDKDT